MGRSFTTYTGSWRSFTTYTPNLTVCVVVDFTAAFDTVCHITDNNAMDVILPLKDTVCNKLQGYQVVGKTSPSGVPRGSQLSPSLITFYVADMPSPTELINRVSYAYGITVWVSGEKNNGIR